MNVCPTSAEIDNAEIEEALAFKEFAEVSKRSTSISLKVIAAHKKLTLARAHKRAVIRDLLIYS